MAIIGRKAALEDIRDALLTAHARVVRAGSCIEVEGLNRPGTLSLGKHTQDAETNLAKAVHIVNALLLEQGE